MKLMIIESPNKIKKLQAILGDGWEIMASYGHIRDLPRNEMGVEKPDFIPQYEFTPKVPNPKKKGEFFDGSEVRVKRMKAKVREADEVYLATDPDREGESISWHLLESLELDDYKRVEFNEITESAVKEALRNVREIDYKLVASQEARRVLDRFVGYTVSPVLCQQSGAKLSAGRVQSPALRLVKEREDAIRAFKMTKHYGALLTFADAKTGDTWTAEWDTSKLVSEDNPYFMDFEHAQLVAQTKAVSVLSFNESEASRNPPAPFTTSSMQQAASVTLGLNPSAAMDAAQNLFAQGHITYHRTDNPNVSADSMADIQAVAEAMGLDMVSKQRMFKAPEGSQAGHPAITPTHWEVEEAGENDEQRALYRLIRQRAIACQLAAARYAVRETVLQASTSVGGSVPEFKAKGRTLIYSGWLKLIDKDQTEDEDESDAESSNPIPLLGIGDAIESSKGNVLEKKTKAPPRYTEASLVKALEDHGIGRPATYAAIMNNITSRGYVEFKGKYLIPTETGEYIINALVNRFNFIDLGYTREIEKELDLIAQGKANYKTTISNVYDKLMDEIATLQSTETKKLVETPSFPCPDCGKPLRRIKGQSGFFWGCTGYPECSTSLPDENGKVGQKKVVSDFACKECGKPLVHRFKKGKGGYDFWGCTGFKEGCKASYENKKGEPVFKQAKS